MKLQRSFNLFHVSRFVRRKAVPGRTRVGFFDIHRGDDSERAAHAKADHPDFGARLFQVLGRAANVLGRRVAEI